MVQCQGVVQVLPTRSIPYVLWPFPSSLIPKRYLERHRWQQGAHCFTVNYLLHVLFCLIQCTRLWLLTHSSCHVDSVPHLLQNLGSVVPQIQMVAFKIWQNSRKFCILLDLSNISAQPLFSFVTSAKKPGNRKPASYPGIARLGTLAACICKWPGRT